MLIGARRVPGSPRDPKVAQGSLPGRCSSIARVRWVPWVRRAAFVAAAVTALSLGFERLDGSLGITQDLRLTNLRAVAAITLCVWLLGCGLERRWPRVPKAVALPVGLWLASVVASALLAPAYQTQALAFTRDVIFGAVCGWAAYDLASDRWRQVWLARALALGGLAVAVLGVAEATGVRLVVDWLTGFRYQPAFGLGEIPRMSSTLPHPNILAMLLGLLLPLLLAWSLAARSRWLRIGLGLGVLVELVALVLTLSRAGLLVTEVVLGLMLALAVRQRQATLARWSLSAAAGLLVLMGVALVAQPLVLLHLTGEGIQGWYAAAYSTPDGLVAAPGQLTTVPVVVRNTGARTWSATGEHAFALSYHLDRADGTLVDFEGARTFLPRDVPPGAAVELQALVQAPPAAGRYVVEWDGVQDQVTWFSWAGTPAARSQLIVAGAEGSGAREPAGGGRAVSAPPPAPDRLTQWRIALRMARYRPVLGIGPDNFRWRYGDFAGVARWDTGGHANSVYVEWLADTGVLGLGLFGWLAWVLVRASGRGLLCRSAGAEPGWLWRVGLAGSLVGWFLHGAVDYFYEPLGTNLGFWLIAGLALAMAPLATRSRSGVVDACG